MGIINRDAVIICVWICAPCQEALDMLAIKDPSPQVLKQRQCMEYVLRSVLDGPHSKNRNNLHRLRLLIHGPGGCGKSVVARAAAHMLRQAGRGVVLAAPTGVAACNINGVTLHSSLLLPVINQSYGKACDVPLPRGEQLAALHAFWKHVDVLMIDEMSFVSEAMLERVDQHLRLARDMPHLPFGGVHLILLGDLYQLPPPKGLDRCKNMTWQNHGTKHVRSITICILLARKQISTLGF